MYRPCPWSSHRSTSAVRVRAPDQVIRFDLGLPSPTGNNEGMADTFATGVLDLVKLRAAFYETNDAYAAAYLGTAAGQVA
jgi:hypothetical protein